MSNGEKGGSSILARPGLAERAPTIAAVWSGIWSNSAFIYQSCPLQRLSCVLQQIILVTDKISSNENQPSVACSEGSASNSLAWITIIVIPCYTVAIINHLQAMLCCWYVLHILPDFCEVCVHEL